MLRGIEDLLRFSKPGTPADNDHDIEEDHQGTDDDYESQNLPLKWRHARLRVVRQSGNFTKDSSVTS